MVCRKSRDQSDEKRLKQDWNSLSKPPSPIGQFARHRCTKVAYLFNPFNGENSLKFYPFSLPQKQLSNVSSTQRHTETHTHGSLWLNAQPIPTHTDTVFQCTAYNKTHTAKCDTMHNLYQHTHTHSKLVRKDIHPTHKSSLRSSESRDWGHLFGGDLGHRSKGVGKQEREKTRKANAGGCCRAGHHCARLGQSCWGLWETWRLCFASSLERRGGRQVHQQTCNPPCVPSRASPPSGPRLALALEEADGEELRDPRGCRQHRLELPGRDQCHSGSGAREQHTACISCGTGLGLAVMEGTLAVAVRRGPSSAAQATHAGSQGCGVGLCSRLSCFSSQALSPCL